MRLLVFGGWYGSGNLGDEAILIGVKEIFKRVLPEGSLLALSINPEYTRRMTGVDSVQLKSPRGILGDYQEYDRIFRETSACIITGGTPIYDYDFFSRSIHWVLPIINGSTVFLFGVGAKKVKSFIGRVITKRLMNLPRRISVRDAPSYQVLQGFSRIPIRLTGDSALYFPFKIQRSEEKKVVVCPRYLNLDHRSSYHDFLTYEQINRIKQTVARICDYLVGAGFTVIFVPFHVVAGDDDRREISDIIKLMKNKDVEVLVRPGSPKEFLVLLENSTFVFGLRLHSLVLSALVNVPFLSIGYDSKICGFMNLMGMDSYLGLLDDDIFSFYEKIEKILRDQDKLEKLLKSEVKAIQKRILEEAEIIASSLSS